MKTRSLLHNLNTRSTLSVLLVTTLAYHLYRFNKMYLVDKYFSNQKFRTFDTNWKASLIKKEYSDLKYVDTCQFLFRSTKYSHIKSSLLLHTPNVEMKTHQRLGYKEPSYILYILYSFNRIYIVMQYYYLYQRCQLLI